MSHNTLMDGGKDDMSDGWPETDGCKKRGGVTSSHVLEIFHPLDKFTRYTLHVIYCNISNRCFALCEYR